MDEIDVMDEPFDVAQDELDERNLRGKPRPTKLDSRFPPSLTASEDKSRE